MSALVTFVSPEQNTVPKGEKVYFGSQYSWLAESKAETVLWKHITEEFLIVWPLGSKGNKKERKRSRMGRERRKDWGQEYALPDSAFSDLFPTMPTL